MTKEQADQILKELEMLRKLKILEMVEKGHSQVALAQLLGLSQPTISRMVLAHPLHLLKKRFHIFVFHGALIVRIENDGSVRDRSRYLYRKDPSVRKYRENIIRLADNRRAAARVPTKRRPLIQGLQGIKTTKTITRQELRRKKPLNVLYLTANPDPAHSLRVGVEVRQVQDAVRGSPYRDNIALQYRPAADLNSLIEGLNDYRPRIVHFSGHGDSSGIAVDNPEVTRRPIKIVSFDLLAKALSATDVPPEIVVLNACESARCAESITAAGKDRHCDARLGERPGRDRIRSEVLCSHRSRPICEVGFCAREGCHRDGLVE